ncbi:FAD/NAD-P-binding domain-containing protein [Stereum hirsutum FP-91666 SS1]|uniref:FAD/NAD-P-binding domain-containing protein n=1 Tax=Stereum hirsutum (strain FP-91666) TaxID=721885 RepID=UPI0004449241|nr:FAD/NAD-P-binding domain-containing protein [Stereum hirsutum FP-91666 SS1]EIM83202.1 FAD/NAD-P-binding domain-containing protein [Stereum hirsutum FP-91666 SS1]
MAEIPTATAPSRLQNVEEHLQKSSDPQTGNSNGIGHVHLNSGGTQNANANANRTTKTQEHQNGEFSIDDYRRMKVVCIGAGYSGIVAGIRFQQRIPNIDFTIYEKQAGVGGTWFANRYPGLACDIPSHCYQLTFEENSQWSAFYAPGPEILAYLRGVVDKYKLMKHIRLQHELVSARWDENAAKWILKIRRPVVTSSPPDGRNGIDGHSETNGVHEGIRVEYEEFEDTADVLFLGTGVLSRWAWPAIEGLHSFKGKLLHSAQWDVHAEGETWQEGVKDWGDKNVGVIGLGSSAIQIVPALQPKVKRLTNFVKGKTWISASFAEAKLWELLKREPQVGNFKFTQEDLESFKDPEYYKRFRHDLEADLNSSHAVGKRDSEAQRGAVVLFKEVMRKKLAKKPWIADYIIPVFGVGCRRLTPGPGFLESLCEDNVDLETTPIKRITPTGIELTSSTHIPLDVLICATGFDTSYHLPFTITGRNNLSLLSRWTPHAESYLSLAVDGFPNMFLSLGPNSSLNSGSLLVLIEKQVDYAVECVRKLQRERLRSMEVKREAVMDYDEYVRAYFPKTVYTDQCNSWYKSPDGAITGLWPGSGLHGVVALSNPRWEDFDYERLDRERTKNRFFWLGDGETENEKYIKGDRAWYLNDEHVDRPPGTSL